MNQFGKLINRILGLRLLISSFPDSASRTHVGSLCKPHDVNKRSRSLASKLDIINTYLVFSIFTDHRPTRQEETQNTKRHKTARTQLKLSNLLSLPPRDDSKTRKGTKHGIKTAKNNYCTKNKNKD